MAVELDYTKLSSSGVIRWDWYAAGSFANPYWPTATELNAGLPLSDVLDLSETDFNIEASNTSNDPTFADTANTENRGAMQYGGGLSLRFPRENDDPTNPYSVVQDALQQQRLLGYVARRIDGNKPWNQAYAAGDFVSLFLVMTDGEALAITGEEAFRYTIQALQQGLAAIYTVVGSTSTPTIVAPATLTPEPGAVGRLTATVNGRPWTNGIEWSTSDPDVITIRKGGVWTVTGSDTDTATITASAPNSTATDTVSVTVTA